MINQRSFFFNVDWVTILLFIALITIGWFSIYAAVYNQENQKYLIDFATNSGKQLLFIIVALIIGAVILLLDSKFFYVLAPVFYGITLILLVAVLLVGRNVGGNQAWIAIGSFRLQPSEFAKLTTSLLLARYIGSLTGKLNDFSNVLPAAAILLFPMFLIMLQPDTGSALVFISLVFVLYREGLSSYFLIAGFAMIVLFVFTLIFSKVTVIIAIIVLAALAIYIYKKNRSIIAKIVAAFLLSLVFIFCVDFVYNNVLQSHQKSRVDLLLGLINDPRGAGYNVNQSKIAIGSGGLIGRGYLQGTQTKFNFVPEQSTDFIFCTIGEEWGFAGTSFVVGLYIFLILRLIFIAERQRAPFSRIYGYAVACIIFCHFFINVGMTIGLVPVIGIPLPFISYGGSSLISFTILLFILLKLDSNRMGII